MGVSDGFSVVEWPDLQTHLRKINLTVTLRVQCSAKDRKPSEETLATMRMRGAEAKGTPPYTFHL